MLRKVFLPLFLIFALIQCSNNANQYLIEDFEIPDSEATVSLLLLELDILFDGFPDHQFGALRPNERMIFDSELVEHFSSQTGSNVAGKLNADILNSINFELRTFGVNNNELEILTPLEGSVLSDSRIESRFVVILDRFYFTPYQVEVGSTSYAGHDGDVENRLSFDLKYLIWDNESGNAIAWGAINTNEILFLNDQNRTYRSLLRDAFNRIVNVSPFTRVGSPV